MCKIFICFSLSGQDFTAIKGQLINRINLASIPFVRTALSNKGAGIVANETGVSEYIIPNSSFEDSLITSCQDSESNEIQTKQAILIEDLSNKLELYSSKFKQEKIYVHSDKNVYQPGDTMWLKSYILDYATNQLSNLSNTLYVTIYDEKGTGFLSRKLLLSENGTHGELILPDTLKEGIYNLVAYTSWMKNFEPDCVYRKEFELRRIFNKEHFVKVLFDKNVYKKGDTIGIDLQISTINNSPLRNLKYRYDVNQNNELLISGKGKTDVNGKDKFQLIIPPGEGRPVLNIILSNEGKEYRKVYSIPVSAGDIDLQFFPEGGDLIYGLESKIAFKAINEYGECIDIKGEVLDDRLNRISMIQSYYKGMGFFKLTPDSSLNYFVRIIEPEEYSKLIPLTVHRRTGLVMSIAARDSALLRLKVKCTPEEIGKYICILMQMRGIKYYAVEGKINGDIELEIPTTGLPSGIASITLFDHQMIPLAERLVFLNKERKLNVELVTNSEEYLPREKVYATIRVSDESGSPVPAVISVSFTDEALSFSSQIESSTIQSSILLESELKGIIPTPDYYFDNNNPESDSALDLVMMTNGWRRFSWDSVLSRNVEMLPDPSSFDMVQGTVFKKNGKPAIFANVSVTQFNPPRITEIITDNDGRFSFNFQLVPDSLNKLGFIAKSQKGRKNVEIVLDEPFNDRFSTDIDNYIKTASLFSDQYMFSKYGISQAEQEDYLLNFDDLTIIPEVTVIGRRVEKEESMPSYHSRHFGHYKKGEELNPNVPVELWIMDINPSAMMERGQILFRRVPINFTDRAGFNYGEPLIVIDGKYRCVTFADLRMFDLEQIEGIGTLQGEDAFIMYGEDALFGAIIVTTKKDYVRKPFRVANLTFLNIYSPVREFYSPKYQTPNQVNNNIPDLRTTIYWNPNLYIDESGIGNISFYNADRICKIKGVVEAQSINGRLGHTSINYNVKK